MVLKSKHLNKKATISGLSVITSMFAILTVSAAEIEPRSYINTPVGINFLLSGYSYSKGGLVTVLSSPVKNADLKMHTGVLAYARSLDIKGKSSKLDIIIPYSDLSGTATWKGEPRERDVSGLIDPRFRFSVNFYGAPALSLKDFSSYQQDLIIGGSIQVSAPLGQYDSDKLVNLGSNRWYIKPDLGISKAWGPLALELSSGVFIFSKNDDYFGGQTLEQDPLYSTQLHTTYNFKKGLWGAVSLTYDSGGKTSVDGEKNDDSQSNSRIGATLALPVNKNNSVKLFASKSMNTRVGSDIELIGIVWQYRWGNGL
jgi:hypothetical protein